jgi:hypothetical protein
MENKSKSYLTQNVLLSRNYYFASAALLQLAAATCNLSQQCADEVKSSTDELITSTRSPLAAAAIQVMPLSSDATCVYGNSIDPE